MIIPRLQTDGAPSPQQADTNGFKNRFTRHVILTCLAAALVCYLLQIVSPLRLNYDVIEFLSIAESANSGGFAYHGSPRSYPPGYPAIVSTLNVLGLGRAELLYLCNVAFLLVAVVASYVLLRRVLNLSVQAAAAIELMTLLSFVVIKHTPLFLSDIPFMGVVMVALVSISRLEAPGKDFAWKLALALALTAAAVCIRTAGLPLVPALMFTVFRRGLKSGQYRSVLAYRIIIVVLGVLALTVALRSKYLLETLDVIRHELPQMSVGALIQANIKEHLQELGEVVANVPASKLPLALHGILPWAGAALIGLTALGIWARRCAAALDIFLLSYLLMILAYVGIDARYWMPILPVMFGLAAVGICQKVRLGKIAAVYVLCFSLLGAVAFAYSTRLSLAGPEFAERYGDDNLRPTYRVALGKTAYSPSVDVNMRALELLRKYDPTHYRGPRDIQVFPGPGRDPSTLPGAR